MNQTPPWEYKEGNILYDGKALTDAESIKRKLSVALEKLHALKRSGFDIRPINVLISKENGEPYLFDFDLQFGGRRDIDIGEVAEQMLFCQQLPPLRCCTRFWSIRKSFFLGVPLLVKYWPHLKFKNT